MSVPKVSERQKDILRLIEDGFDAEMIAEELVISQWTVRDQVRRLAGIFMCRLPDLPARARERGVVF